MFEPCPLDIIGVNVHFANRRSNVHNKSAAPFRHFRNDSLRHAPHAKHIGVKSALDIPNVLINQSAWEVGTVSLVLFPACTCSTWRDQACIVDQDVDAPFLLNDLLYNFLDLFILRNV